MVSETLSLRPLYLQARDLLLQRIAQGTWRPGRAIPNEHDIARELGVSPGTVRKALASLEQDEVIYRRQGRGTFVTDPASRRFSNLRLADGSAIKGKLQQSKPTIQEASPLEQQRLELGPDELVARMRRVRFNGAHPHMIEDISVPEKHFKDIDKLVVVPDFMTVLAMQHGIVMSGAAERVTVEKAPPELAALLQVAPGTTLFNLDRTIHMLDGPPIQWRVGWAIAEGYMYRTENSHITSRKSE